MHGEQDMAITVLLFASFREAVGVQRCVLELPEASTPSNLYDLLQQSYPALEQMRPYVSFAVNRTMTGPNTRLQDGDEVALLQPVSGGSDA